MFKGTYFYHERIKKTVSLFGSLFNNIYIIRHKNDDEEVLNQIRVPLAYAPKRKYIERLAQNPNLEEDTKVAVKLPRMSFEITGFNRNTDKTKSKFAYQKMADSSGKARKLFSPVPYDLNFELNVYVKAHEDALQIVEQIVPFFDDPYHKEIMPFKDIPTHKEDVSITLNGFSHSDDYENSLESRRTIIYTFNFTVSVNFYKPTDEAISIINKVRIDVNGVEKMEEIPDKENNFYTYTLSIVPNEETPDEYDFGFTEEEFIKYEQ